MLEEIARTTKSDDTRSTAQLALGALALTLARPEPKRADAIVAWAMKAMEAARSPAEKRQMLLVLGNTAAAQTLPVIRTHLMDRDAGVRAAAVAALRWHRARTSMTPCARR